ncbi:MAG: ligase-associated DNA damage response exonuclease [Cyanobacteria bacterium SZAS-4]|nr:ligase-associated DNA damage response exonuclease [Cyanobacteria bacterium SZAS-4]
MSTPDLVKLTDAGLYCEYGDFYIDPWRPVGRAIITHAHADHARPGNTHYLAAAPGKRLLSTRLEPNSSIQTVEYGEAIKIGEVTVSLHSAGHVLGSAQIRIEKDGEVWVVSGDYKTEEDATCAAFELVPCHTFITESTFGLPIFRWKPQQTVFDEINKWWRSNQEAGKTSLLFGYALGKAQRILSGVDATIGPIYTHGAVEKVTQAYRDSGIALPDTQYVGTAPKGTKYSGSLIVAPPSAQATPWTRVFGTVSTAFASGWMRIRGTRRRKSMDRGFVLSDHADWVALNQVIRDTGAEHVIVTHGYAAEMVRWLNEGGIKASSFSTKFEGERDELQPTDQDSESTEESSETDSGIGAANMQDEADLAPTTRTAAAAAAADVPRFF